MSRDGKPQTATSASNQHLPVMLDEVLVQASETARDLKRALRFGFDGTFGRGGHTRELLRAHPSLAMVAFDQDQDAIRFGAENFSEEVVAGRLKLVRSNFEAMELAKGPLAELAVASEKSSSGGSARSAVHGFDFMLFDLGVSSPQLDVAARGFSFYHDGPLDMRMDDRLAKTAETIINQASDEELIRIFREFGEIEYPNKVVRAIVQDRVSQPFTSTKQLAGLIERVDGWAKKGFHPATQYFMALRLEVNRELEAVSQALPCALELLAPGGRLAVITFHSLEDRIVKNLFRDVEEGTVLGPTFGENVKRKAFKPSEKEITGNARSRSAKLRVFRRFELGETKSPKNKYAHLAEKRHLAPPDEEES